MVYTGRLPLGKHNVSRIVAAADNLQMFDVAVCFKNVLTSLVNQHTDTQTSNHWVINKAQNVKPGGSSPSNKDDLTSHMVEPKMQNSQGDSEGTDGSLRTYVEQSGSQGRFTNICIYTDTAVVQHCLKCLYTESEKAKSPAHAPSDSGTGLLEHSSQLVELLSNMASVLELLSQAAQSSLDEKQSKVEQDRPVMEIVFLPILKA